jgi:hypothetical protein
MLIVRLLKLSEGGRYFVDEHDARSSPLSYDEQLARRLWEASTRLAGLSPG